MNAITETIMQDQDSDLAFTFKSRGDPDAGLVVRSFRAEEAVSALYRIEIELAAERADIDLAKLLDKPALLTLHDRYGEPRHLHGLVEEAHQGDTGEHRTFYRVVLMPKLHRLRFVSDARIFQARSVPEIVESVLRDNGVSDYSFDLRADHARRDYVVQYRETSFDFIARLLAEEGIHYTHEHGESGHKLVMRDTSSVAPDVPVTASLDYNANPGGDVKGPFAKAFTRVERVESSAVALADQHFLHPRYTFPAVYEAGRINGLAGKLEHYEFPGRHKTDEAGAAFARYRLEHMRGLASHGKGAGRFAHATAGALFELAHHPARALNRKYFLTRVVQGGRQPGALEEDTGSQHRADGGGTFLDTAFEVVAADQPFRPAQRVKPMADGPHLAIVTGPSGEEIYTDEHSRVKVRFFWDRHARDDDTSSCWIRVAQNWGGAQWGHIAIPRVGQSVLVSYVNDDIEQPLVTGRAYNADNHTPYALPGHKTKMAIRSQTHKGEGFNEMSFEDENGGQNFFMHAQKDMTSKVLNNQVHAVDASGFHSYGQQHQLTVGANMNHQVGGGLNQVIGAATGAGAQALMGGALGALMGQSAGMLQAAMSIAGAAAANQSGDAAAKTVGAAAGAVAQAATAGLETATSGGAGGGSPASGAAPAEDTPKAHGASLGTAFAAPADTSQQSTAAGDHSSSLAGGALGAASQLFDKAFSSATSATPNDMTTAGGASMASAGSSLLGQLGSMVGGGILNQLVGMMKNTNVGVASTEQIGTAKVSTVGQVFKQAVGHSYHIDVGDEFVIGVGASTDKDGKSIPPKSLLIMKKDGTVLLQGVNVYVAGENHVQVISEMIDHN